MGKGDVGDGLVGMNADPFVQIPAIFVEFLHQHGFVGTAGKGVLQQSVNPGAILNRQYLNFHSSPGDDSSKLRRRSLT